MVREQVADEFGIDASYLYSPHVSMTGFFEATLEEAVNLGWTLKSFMKNIFTRTAFMNSVRHIKSPDRCAPGMVQLGRVISTDDGYVILDLDSGILPDVMREFVAMVDVKMRAKRINHMTLAKDRSAMEREALKRIWESNLAKANFTADWRVVVYELIEKVPESDFSIRGPHRLMEVISIPLGISKERRPSLPIRAEEVSPVPRISVC